MQSRAGQFFEVVAEQEGADVVVEVIAPDGKSLIQVDSPNSDWGPEPAQVIAAESGEFHIVVTTSVAEEGGKYVISLKTIREAEPSDPERLQLQDFMAQGAALIGKSQIADSLGAFLKADVLAGKLGDSYQQMLARNMEGNLALGLGQPQRAIDYLTQALSMTRTLGDMREEAATLQNIGAACNELGQPRKALEYFQQALPIGQKLGNARLEADILDNMGNSYSDSGQLQKALEVSQQALPILRAIGDHQGEVEALNDIGSDYWALNQPQKARDYIVQAMQERAAANDLSGEAITLNNIALIEDDLGQRQKALDDYNQALALDRQVGNQLDEALTLMNIGVVYYEADQPEKALDFYNQSLALCRVVGDRETEASTLLNIAKLQRKGKDPAALSTYLAALGIAREIGDLNIEGTINYGLMLSARQAQPAVAIFFGKEAINDYQQMRGNIQGLDKELQKSFVSSKENVYHQLANLLIDEGRLPEAQQVLDLLKQEEYTEYVRGNAAKMMGPLTLTPAERQAEEDYQKSTAQLVTEEQQWAQLKKIAARTPEQEKQFQKLSDELAKANQGLNDYYNRLYALFGKNSGANKQVADVQGDAVALRQQIAKMPHTIALYTVVAEDRYSVVVIAGNAPMAGRKYDITAKDLNQKVAAFQQVLRDPSKDPRPIAQELYTILIGPVKADLDQAHAQTLIWSLDGVLRYIPMAALYDGKQYLVESYNIVSFTPASISYLGDKPEVDNLSAVAMGISRKYEDDLNPLPTVVSELDDIVKDPQVKGANGVLPGSILLNGQFTERAMESQLDGQHAIVHIASHFVFKPGDDNQSYLLLAGKNTDSVGYHLTVADFRDDQNLSLNDTDLLTLSACETGVGGSAGNGREVDGLATTAQLKGAKAVISSLWDVNDASTGELMADFYKRWAEGGGKVMKVDALREAQLDLLNGRVKPDSDPNAPASYAHPYYWAPFVLMGNWR